MHNLIRVESAAMVETMGAANHAPFTRTAYAASVTLADTTYFWCAA